MNKFLWIWCLVNTVGLLMMLVIFGCNGEYDRQQDQHIQELEVQVRECQSAIAVQPDTIVVNIYNNITQQ